MVASLSEPIGHAPVSRDLPGHDAVVQPGHSVIPLERLVPVFGDLLSRRLLLADLVGAARHDFGRVSIPSPRIAEADVRHALRRALELGAVPRLPTIGGNLRGTNGAAAGPSEPADLVESLARQPLIAGRVRDDRFGTDLEG